MDEAQTVEENATINGGRSGNLVNVEDDESPTKVTGLKVNNGEVVFGGSLPKQNVSEGPAIKQESLTDSKPLDSPIDDRLRSSPEPVIQQTKDKQPDYKLSEMEDGEDHVHEKGLTCQNQVKKSRAMGQDHVQEDGLIGQDQVKKNGQTGQDHVRENGLTGEYQVKKNGPMDDHVQEDGLTGHDQVKKDGLSRQDHVKEYEHTGQDHVHQDGSMDQDHAHKDGSTSQECPSGLANGKIHNQEGTYGDASKKLEKVSLEKTVEKSKSFSAEIDTTAPFESVKAAVSMFGGIVDWKTHKIQIAERRRYVAQELRKANEQIPIFKKKSEAAEESKQQALKELDNTKRLLEELKLNLERAETEEHQAKQDAELAKLRVEEMEQGIAEESSVAAKAQLEVAQARHQSAVSELKTVKTELINLQKDYNLLQSDRDLAIKNAEEAVFSSKEIERNVEGLTIKLITTKEELESAHAAHLEAEEHRTTVAMAREEELLNWEEEMKQSEQELEKVNQQITETQDLKLKLDNALVLLQNLKSELGAYMEENHKDIQSTLDLANMDLEELKKNIEKETDEVNRLKQTATSLSLDLEKEKETLVAAKKREELAAIPVEALEADLKKTISEVELIQKKEKEARERTLQLPRQLEQSAEEAGQARLRVQKAHQELQKATEAANQAKDGEKNMVSKLNASLKEIEAVRASERLALGAINALHESESARNNQSEPESKITLSVEEYYDLSRLAKEAEDEASTRVSEAISQVELAKESELNAQNKLEQVNLDIASKKEQLSNAMHRAEVAKEGKTTLEHELRTWRSEHEQKLKANASGGYMSFFSSKSTKSSESHKLDTKTESNNNGSGSSEVKPRKKKKRSFFPRFFMFFSRKKTHSSKKNT
ncbi:hypothetical protein R6Q59_010626 [Mikania micrantha]